MNEKLLILESNWADAEANYLLDSRSVSQIYGSIEKLLSVGDHPLSIIQRPLLKCRFAKDLEQFVSLESNKRGINVVILCGHGWINRGHSISRQLTAIDGEINLSVEIRKLKEKLGRTIIVLDSCSVGEKVKSFRAASGALGVIGFARDVNWVDSAVFILAVLCHFHQEGVFFMQKKSAVRPKRVMERLHASHYGSFFEELGVEYAFAEV